MDAMHRSLLLLLLCPSLLAAQAPASVPWQVALSGAEKLANGECRSISIDLKDSTGKSEPRRADGNRVSLADFDMAVTPAENAVGKYAGPASWAVCACQGTAAGTLATVTATYPAEKLATKLRIAGVAFTASMPVTITGPGGNSLVAAGCPTATKTTLSLAGAPALQTATMAPTRAQASAASTAAPTSSNPSSTVAGPVSAALMAPSDGTLYVTVTSSKQGVFKAETPNGFVARAMAYQSSVPQSAGQPTGHRVYTPVTITMEWSAATGQLMAALAGNELLTVRIDRRRPGTSGTDQVTESITLKNSRVVAIKHFTEGKRELDDVSFAVSDITYTNVVNNFVMQDNMSSP
jgi:type VI protein secretion system component Hcp